MAIPYRTTVTCPTCGATEAITVADTSVGPARRPLADGPAYGILPSPNWSQSQRDGETWIGCARCGQSDFTTLAILARHSMRTQRT